ncbi:MAG: NTP transferase domain-containing protein [Gammaproteobacteria bacterium]
MHSSLSGLVDSFRSRVEKEKVFVLATIVETAGSTYRKPGARMLITENGDMYGLLSGGCLEADLYEHARKVFRDKADTSVFYDMRSSDDLIWGLGLGCDGAVRIRLEYLCPENNYAPLSLIEKALASSTPAVVVTVIDSEHEGFPAGTHFLFPEEDSTLPKAIFNAARDALIAGRSSSRTVEVDGGSITLFLGMVEAPTRLLVIGAGPDAVPVTEAARLLGWTITVVDYREAFCETGKFPAADHVIHSAPEELDAKLDLPSFDAAVLMTHKLEYDQRYLARLAGTPLNYIGLLGPAARKQELLKYLGDEKEKVADRVYGPVGLDIGARLPEEIAFSLIAEIQAVLRNRGGGSLSLQQGSMKAAVPAATREQLYGVVLAAGGSRRFGALKQLLEFDGRSLLRHAAEKAHSLLDDRIIVVHGPKPTKCQREIAAIPAVNVVNEDWHAGMATSLKVAMHRLPEECAGILILLCDQPLVEQHHLELLVEAWERNPESIVAAEYADTRGVPAIIPRRFFDELRSLHGDTGAKSVIRNHDADVIPIPLEEASVDIDTQTDYESLLRRNLLSG